MRRATRRAGRLLVLLSIALAGMAAEQARQNVSIIVTGGTVVTVNATRQVLSPGALAIDGTDIVAVGRPEDIAARYTAAETIDATGAVVMPGLINTHTHAPMVMFRGLADDLALMDWLRHYIFPAEAKTVSADFVKVGTNLAVLEMIQSGTTLYADMYYFEDEIARATRAAGLRGVLGETIIGFPSPDAKTPAESLARAARMVEEFKDDPLIVPAVAPHSMYTLDRANLEASRDLAARHRIPMIIHLAETRDEVKISLERYKRTPVKYLESIGFFGPRTLIAHAVHVAGDEVPILERRHVGVSHNPESNMKLASGTAPIQKYLAAGLSVGLGTDGAASNNDLDMFEAMRQAAFLHKLVNNNPQAVPAEVVIEMATMGGARALGLGAKLGSLEGGKKADLIVVSMTSARTTPMYNALSHLVYVSRGDDVTTTIVNGKVLMRDRKVLTLDERSVTAEANRLAERVRAAVRP